MRQTWSDDRLDALNEKVDERFAQVELRFDRIEGDVREIRGELKELRSETKAGFESLQQYMVVGVVALTSGMLAGFASMVGLVATQL